MKKPKKPRVCRTLRQVQQAFAREDVRQCWSVCIDPAGLHFLRYFGPIRDGREPAEPINLALEASPWKLLVEALELAGIPAEQA